MNRIKDLAVKIVSSRWYGIIWVFIVASVVFRDDIYSIALLKPFEILVALSSIPLLISIAKPVREFSKSSKILILLGSALLLFNLLSNLVGYQYLDLLSNLLNYGRLLLVIFISVVIVESISLNINLSSTHILGYLLGTLFVAVVYIVFSPVDYRPSSTLGDPNFLASFLIIPLNILFFKIYQSLEGSEFSLQRVFHISLLFLVSFMLFSTISRSGIAAALGSLLLLGGYVVFKERGFSTVAKVLIVFLIPMLSWATLLIFNWEYRTELLRRFSLESISSQTEQQRQALWEKSFAAISEKPLGYGLGQLEVKIREENSREVIKGHSTQSHSLFLEVAGAFGWLGLLVFSGFLLYFFICVFKLFQIINYRGGRYGLLTDPVVPLTSSFIGLLAYSMFFDFLFTRYFWMVLALLLGVYEFLNREDGFAK